MVAPSISVVIPCYNASKYLSATIDSVLAQSFSDYEIIVIDDGSIDNTQEVICGFGDRVRAEYRSNQGASAARNRGTELAQGEFIQYLDADDLLRPDALEKKIAALKLTGADVAYSDWQRLIENRAGEFLPGDIITRQIEDSNADLEIALFIYFWAPPAALLYRRKIVDAIGGWNESLPIIQDARFLLDAGLMGGKFVYVPGIQADYRVHKTHSLSRSNPTKFVLDCFNNACQIEDLWRTNGGITKQRQIALQTVYGQVARFFFEHDRSKFHEILQRLHQLDPHYLPAGPQSLRFLSKYFGYEQAELIALAYRRLKSQVHKLTISPN